MAKKKTVQSGQPFPVIGIGGSAGAIDAVVEIAANLPAHTGMAYIYLQHQNPNVDGNLPELIGKHAKISVLKAEDRMPVEADFFYVIPAGKEITLSDGALRFKDRDENYDYMPVNRFLTSLADQYKEFAIGIILSGADGDGAEGVKAIKAFGGLTFAQDGTALFESMPKTAIAEGAVDLVLSPKEIADELRSISKQKETYYNAIQGIDSDTISNKAEDLEM